MGRSADERQRTFFQIDTLLQCEFFQDKHKRWLYKYECKTCKRKRQKRLWDVPPRMIIHEGPTCERCFGLWIKNARKTMVYLA